MKEGDKFHPNDFIYLAAGLTAKNKSILNLTLTLLEKMRRGMLISEKEIPINLASKTVIHTGEPVVGTGSVVNIGSFSRLAPPE